MSGVDSIDVDLIQISKQMRQCNDYPDYSSFVVCKGALLEPLKDEIAGDTVGCVIASLAKLQYRSQGEPLTNLPVEQNFN